MQIEWNENHLTGFDKIDQEHQQLFRIINRLFQMAEDKSRVAWACRESVKFFEAHTVQHFLDEEEIMRKQQYPDYVHHKELHDSFRELTFPALAQELEDSNYSQEAIDHFIGVCAGWLMSHTLTEDLAIVGKGTTTARMALSGEETQPLEQIILDYIRDMFSMKGKIVTRRYSGERFGKGVYYRLTYALEGQPDKTEDIVFVFEESTLLNSVGLALGAATLDNSVMHAMRYIARQLVEFIHQHSFQGKKYTLVEDELLTYNDFRDLLVEQKPQVSLLFNTGTGYFAFCMMAPHKLRVGGAVQSEDQRSTEEIDQYLQSRLRADQKQRKKVLLVDDSLAMRENMRELLKRDYEISLAESGVSALRAMTLSQPDMVLLDYDMPIVDGKQILLMMKSEDAFADIPVVFLTGLTDPKGIKELLALKPLGFLLKSMPQETLKEKIDALAEKLPQTKGA